MARKIPRSALRIALTGALLLAYPAARAAEPAVVCCPPGSGDDLGKCVARHVTAGDPGIEDAACSAGYLEKILPQTAALRCETPAVPALTRVQAALGDGEGCYLKFLKTLGWEFNNTKSGSLGVDLGNPCASDSLEEARQGGSLQINIPETATAEQIRAFFSEKAQPSMCAGKPESQCPSSTRLAQLLQRDRDNNASYCAYKFKLRDAAARATDKLNANRNLKFMKTQLAEFGGGVDDWKRNCLFSPDCTLSATSSKAIATLYTGSGWIDCAVGQQVAQYATAYELLGADGFDREYTPREIQVGNWSALNSEAAGRALSPRDTTPGAEELHELFTLGPQALVGVPGYLGNVLGEDYLDHKPDRGENFLIRDVSKDAARALRDGGLGAFDGAARSFWQLAQDIADKHAMVVYVRSLGEHPAAEPDPSLPEATRKALLGIRGIMTGPLFQGIHVYVHPLGTMTFAQHLARLAAKNPRTPYQLNLYYDGQANMRGYQRYMDSEITACMRAKLPEHIQDEPVRRGMTR